MSKAYKVTKRTVMFDKSNPKTVYSVSPVNYGTLTTDDVANQIAAESSATPGDVKNVLDRFAYYVKENIKKGYQIQKKARNIHARYGVVNHFVSLSILQECCFVSLS